MQSSRLCGFFAFSLLAHFLMYLPMWPFLDIHTRARRRFEHDSQYVDFTLIVEIPLVLSTGSGLKRLGARGMLTAGCCRSAVCAGYFLR